MKTRQQPRSPHTSSALSGNPEFAEIEAFRSEADLSGLARRLANLEARVSDLKRAVDGAAQLDGDIKALRQKVEKTGHNPIGLI